MDGWSASPSEIRVLVFVQIICSDPRLELHHSVVWFLSHPLTAFWNLCKNVFRENKCALLGVLCVCLFHFWGVLFVLSFVSSC